MMKKRTNLAFLSFLVMLLVVLVPPAFGTEIYVETTDVYTDLNTLDSQFIYYLAGGTKLNETYGETSLKPYYFGGSAIVSSAGNFFDKVVDIELVDASFPVQIWIQTYIYNPTALEVSNYHFEIYDSQFTQRIGQVKFLNSTTGYINDYHVSKDVFASGVQFCHLDIEAGISSFGLRQVAVITSAVPEPATMLLLGLGLCGLVGVRRFKK